eukprot:GABV01013294.1.p1 GENE.GABV01013294.1~~GABV01013294.1.p1  ORF type:complete len:105 (-),score=42.63 GABV01013294.1:3-317(-)
MAIKSIFSIKRGFDAVRDVYKNSDLSGMLGNWNDDASIADEFLGLNGWNFAASNKLAAGDPAILFTQDELDEMSGDNYQCQITQDEACPFEDPWDASVPEILDA